MAEVLEAPDEQAQIRDFLEQQRLLEEERRQQEEAARVLAEQDALAAQQQIQDAPPAELPPMPQAVQTAPAPAPSYSVDSQQYANEVARAQRGSGFINADVGPGGNVITPGYDPERDPRAIVARREAENLQRNQYVASLVNGGATMAEALRAAYGRYPGAANPSVAMKAEQLALRQNFKPKTWTEGGVIFAQTGPDQVRSYLAPKPEKIIPGKPSAAILTKDDVLKRQIADLRAQLKPGPAGISLLAPEESEKIQGQIARKEQERIDLFNTPESNPKVDLPGWEAMRDRFNAPPRPQAPEQPAPIATPSQAKAVNEIRRMTKDGKVAVYDAETKKFIRFE